MRDEDDADQADPELVTKLRVALRNAEVNEHFEPRGQKGDDCQIV